MVAKETFDGLDAYRIESGRASALIAARGATLLSWDPGIGESVIAGYDSAAELAAEDGCRSAILAPWPGRVRDAQFSFGGQAINLRVEDDGHARHGFVSRKDFEVVSQAHTLTLRYVHGGDEEWPWPFELTATYSLESGDDGAEHLSLTLELRNTSDGPAPAALGWHPLVRLPGMETINNLSLTVPARTQIATTRDLIPLPGDAAYSGIHAPMSVDYIGSRVFDTGYTSLVPDEEGVVTTKVSDPRSGHSVSLIQEPGEAPVVLIWTSDSATREPRGSIALEPYSHMADALNRADTASQIELEAGQSRTLTATLSYL